MASYNNNNSIKLDTTKITIHDPNGVNVNYLNVSCDEILGLVQWTDAKVLVSLLILVVINFIIIVGNCLVITAVFITTKLRTVTNLFIVSLAVADLLVGIAVLPFSATWEIFEIWIFGELWCSMWLSLDVWMCTASILNLCAISLDRYVAVTRPVTYPNLMSSKKAKALIAAVWILSFLICFPPLVGWNDRKRTFFRQLANTTSHSQFTNNVTDIEHLQFDLGEPIYQYEECTLTCELTNDKGYVVYSAMGSFFLPMFVMLFFYWRIYRAAVETTRAINQGFRTTKGTKLLGTRFEEQRLTLRIHRGRSVQNSSHSHRRTNTNKSTSDEPLSPTLQSNGKQMMYTTSQSGRLTRSRSTERIKVQITPPPPNLKGKRCTSFKPSRNGGSGGYTANFSNRHNKDNLTQGDSTKLNLPQETSRKALLSSPCESENPTPLPSPTIGNNDRIERQRMTQNDECDSATNRDSTKQQPKFISKMGKRNIKAQVKRFRMETKAAKTLGIIVGGFILCWLPFFTMYVIRAFCATCIPPVLFSILFWLGYCNSALNPCILAFFSKDFRMAFKRMICRCICRREKKRPPTHSVPVMLSSLGEDSDGNNENDHPDSRV